MSEYYCHRCEQTIKLDRQILPTLGGLTNMGIWCHNDPILKLNCFSEEALEMMTEIKKSGEKCHLVNWDYSDNWTKIPVDNPIEIVLDTDQKNNNLIILDQTIIIGLLVFLPTVIMISANLLCEYLQK
jgi:hypothetical protein